MLKTFPIDFVRQILEQKLLEEHIIDVNLFGGKEQVAITSFYEQLKSQDEVDRFIETYRDLTEQQNRTGLILNGVLLSPENPTITNLYSSLIVPMAWTCSLRCTLENRDNAIITINNLIEKLKGRKVDVAQLNCIDENGKPYSTPFCVGTLGQNSGETKLKNGDFIGSVVASSTVVDKLLTYFDAFELSNNDTNYVYCENENKIKVVDINKGQQFVESEKTILNYHSDSRDYIVYVMVKLKGSFQYDSNLAPLYNANTGSVELLFDDETTRVVPCDVEITKYELVSGYPEITVKLTLKERVKDDDLDSVYDANCELYYKAYNFIEDDGSYENVVFPPEHTDFEKYKVSLSFDAIRCDEPRNLNEKEYCEISFSGSATLVSNGVQLGNDLLKIAVTKLGYQAENYVSFSNATTYLLEPLELPSGNNANTQINQLLANNFVSNTHTDAIALTLQYTFIYDKNVDLLKQWFNYARYGTRGLSASDITPNLEYRVVEYWCSWGDFESKEIKTKIIENIDIENTESDALTLSLTMQIQGENN